MVLEQKGLRKNLCLNLQLISINTGIFIRSVFIKSRICTVLYRISNDGSSRFMNEKILFMTGAYDVKSWTSTYKVYDKHESGWSNFMNATTAEIGKHRIINLVINLLTLIQFKTLLSWVLLNYLFYLLLASYYYGYVLIQY